VRLVTQRSLPVLLGLLAMASPSLAQSRVANLTGIIELYVEGGRMRFAINVDAVERSGLCISSRLLGLAKVIRNDHVQ
jgi:hypothetical protein